MDSPTSPCYYALYNICPFVLELLIVLRNIMFLKKKKIYSVNGFIFLCSALGASKYLFYYVYLILNFFNCCLFHVSFNQVHLWKY